MANRLKKLLTIALAVVALDQLTKYLAVAYLARHPMEVIPCCFNLILVYNTGAAFGVFSNFAHSQWFLVAATIVAIAVALWIAFGPGGKRPAVRLCIGLVIGGGLGNLIDRLRFGRVVDFAVFYIGNWQWPAFNVADVAITLGGVYLAWLLIRGKA